MLLKTNGNIILGLLDALPSPGISPPSRSIRYRVSFAMVAGWLISYGFFNESDRNMM
jgi:hypothetical protein